MGKSLLSPSVVAELLWLTTKKSLETASPVVSECKITIFFLFFHPYLNDFNFFLFSRNSSTKDKSPGLTLRCFRHNQLNQTNRIKLKNERKSNTTLLMSFQSNIYAPPELIMWSNYTDKSSNLTRRLGSESVSLTSKDTESHFSTFVKLQFCNILREKLHRQSVVSARAGISCESEASATSSHRHGAAAATAWQWPFRRAAFHRVMCGFCVFVESEQHLQQEAGSERPLRFAVETWPQLTFMESQVWRLTVKCPSVNLLVFSSSFFSTWLMLLSSDCCSFCRAPV